MSKETKSKKEVKKVETKKAGTKAQPKKCRSYDTCEDHTCDSCNGNPYAGEGLDGAGNPMAEKPIIRDSFACDQWEYCKAHPHCDMCKESRGFSARHPEVFTPEVMPKDDPIVLPSEAAQIVRYKADAPVLSSIESSIRRDIQLAGKLDKAGAMIAIKIGLALDMAKRMIDKGFYEAWMKAKFGDIFSTRKGYYYLKLANKFQLTDHYRHLQLPEKAEMGNYLAVSDESSDLGNAVAAFVGDLSINELMDKHGVKSKIPGGWHPADRDMEAFVRDYPELRGKPFETWAEADKEKFKSWMTQQQAGDMEFGKKINAEGFWAKAIIDIRTKGLTEKTWSLVDTKILVDLHSALGELHKVIGAAVKG
jgi:hypothetical protein